MRFLIILLTILFCSFSNRGISQNVYKTPSGKKYHLSSCRMVENVSKKVVDDFHQLTPCKICKPPSKKFLQKGSLYSNKAVGESSSVQCKGKTKKGTRCRHKTKLANGYCYQHSKQNGNSTVTYKYQTSSNSTCGAQNKSGGFCKRKVKNGGRCHQHK